MIGAVAHMAFENLVNVDMEVTRLNKTISEFEEAEVEIKDPRKEAAQVLSIKRGGSLIVPRILQSFV